jgi:hypothetical protein
MSLTSVEESSHAYDLLVEIDESDADLNDWEIQFVGSIIGKHEKNENYAVPFRLTEKQVAVIHDMFEKYVQEV